MDIDNLTIKQARELSAIFCGGATATKRLPFASLGTNVFVATITAHYTGKVVAVRFAATMSATNSGRWFPPSSPATDESSSACRLPGRTSRQRTPWSFRGACSTSCTM
jgi:hypothetical protein